MVQCTGYRSGCLDALGKSDPELVTIPCGHHFLPQGRVSFENNRIITGIDAVLIRLAARSSIKLISLVLQEIRTAGTCFSVIARMQAGSGVLING
jgi:hypothetical protein